MQPRKSCSAAGSSACWLTCFPFTPGFAAFLSPCDRPPGRMQRQQFQHENIDFMTLKLRTNYSGAAQDVSQMKVKAQALVLGST